MTLLTSLYSGLNVGLKGSTLTKWGSVDLGPTLLADFNFATPATVGIGGNGTFASSYATDEWLLQETSGTYANNVGSETLSNTGGLQGQTAVGLWDGTSYTARNAWESDSTVANADQLVASGTTAGDSDGEDFAVRIVYRIKGATASLNHFASKRDGNNEGWSLYTGSSDRVSIAIEDAATNTVILTCANNGVDTSGAWGVIDAWYDQSADMLYIKTNLVSESSVSTAGVGSITVANALKVNGKSTTDGQAGVQYAYVGVSVGANAQAFYDEEITLPGSDPSTLLTTQSRASLISVPVSATAVAHFSDDTLPIGYNANFSDTNKLGLYCNSAVTNLVLDSEDLTAASWNKVTMTVAANQMDSPDGFRSAGTATATANNAVIWDAYSMSASTEYTFSCWVKRNGASNVAGKISIWDSVTGHTQQAFTATDTWQLVSVTATIDASQSVGRGYLWVDTNTESISFHMMQMNLGDARGAYIRTSGASAALVASGYTATTAAGAYCKGATGEIELIYCTDFGPVSTGYPLNCEAASGNTDRFYIRQNTNTIRFYKWDGAGVYEDDINTTLTDISAQENTVIIRWDDSNGLADGGSMNLKVNAETLQTRTGTWTGGDTITKHEIGHIGAGAGPIDGYVQRIRFWDEERT